MNTRFITISTAVLEFIPTKFNFLTRWSLDSSRSHIIRKYEYIQTLLPLKWDFIGQVSLHFSSLSSSVLGLIQLGRESLVIEATDPDKGTTIFLYQIVHPNSGRNTLVPLSENENREYNSHGGKEVLSNARLHYENGRMVQKENVIAQDIECKILALKALCDLARNQSRNYALLLEGAVSLDEELGAKNSLRPYVVRCMANSDTILDSFRQDYPQILEESCMGFLGKFGKNIQKLKAEVESLKFFWEI